MNGPDSFPKNERGRERIPSREDILAQIRKRHEGGQVLRELADGEGIYLLEVRTQEKVSGEYTLYVYQRKGTFPNRNEAANTVLEEVYFVNGNPCGGNIVAEFDTAIGEWEER